jgi:hypothetical protein
MPPIKLNPLSDLKGDDRRRLVLMVWTYQGQVMLMKHDSLVGCQANNDYGDHMEMPDGWIEPIEVEE